MREKFYQNRNLNHRYNHNQLQFNSLKHLHHHLRHRLWLRICSNKPKWHKFKKYCPFRLIPAQYQINSSQNRKFLRENCSNNSSDKMPQLNSKTSNNKCKIFKIADNLRKILFKMFSKLILQISSKNSEIGLRCRHNRRQNFWKILSKNRAPHLYQAWRPRRYREMNMAVLAPQII